MELVTTTEIAQLRELRAEYPGLAHELADEILLRIAIRASELDEKLPEAIKLYRKLPRWFEMKIGLNKRLYVNGQKWSGAVKLEKGVQPRKAILLIVGTGWSMLPDLDWCRKHLFPHYPVDIMAINRAAIKLDKRTGKLAIPERIEHQASLHYNMLPGWRRERGQLGGNADAITHSARDHTGVDKVWRATITDGTSSWIGTVAGLAMGYQKIVLAGVPMIDKDGIPYSGARATSVWQGCHNLIRKYVRSLSGWTQELCGSVTEDFLNK